jgi:hypothetical protein
MLDAILDRLEELAGQGYLVDRVCANAFSKDGVGLCRSLSMRSVGPHSRVGEVFALDMEDAHALLAQRPKLRTRLHKRR